MMIYIYAKFHENIFNGIKVMERTRKVNGRTNGRPNRRIDGRRTRHNTTRLRRTYKKAENIYLHTDGDKSVNGLLDMNEHRIIIMQDPLNAGDALTKRYFDTRMFANLKQ